MRRPVQNQPTLLGPRQLTDVTEPRSDTGAEAEGTTECYIHSFYEEVKHAHFCAAGSLLFIETFDIAAQPAAGRYSGFTTDENDM